LGTSVSPCRRRLRYLPVVSQRRRQVGVMLGHVTLDPGRLPHQLDARRQGLTLVHFSAQDERFLWDRGCIWGLCSEEVMGDIWGC